MTIISRLETGQGKLEGIIKQLEVLQEEMPKASATECVTPELYKVWNKINTAIEHLNEASMTIDFIKSTERDEQDRINEENMEA